MRHTGDLRTAQRAWAERCCRGWYLQGLLEIKTCACLSVSGGERYVSAVMATKCTRSSWNFSIPSILRLDYSRLLDVDPLRNVFSDFSATLEIHSECTKTSFSRFFSASPAKSLSQCLLVTPVPLCCFSGSQLQQFRRHRRSFSQVTTAQGKVF